MLPYKLWNSGSVHLQNTVRLSFPESYKKCKEIEVAEKHRQIEFPQFLRVQKCYPQILRYFRPKKVCSAGTLLIDPRF